MSLATSRGALVAFAFLSLMFCARNASAQERCPYDTTGSLAAGAPTQKGRLKNGLASVCATAKTVPVIQNATGAFRYATYGLQNRSRTPACVTVSLVASSGTAQSALYLGAFDPNNPQTNYLADSGPSASASTVSYGATIPALSAFTVTVNAVGAATAKYTLSVTGCGAVVVTGIAPNAGPVAGGTDVTIGGSGFLANPAVTIGGAPATKVVLVNQGSLTATTPPGVAGSANVVVTNADTTSSSLPLGYKYNPPAATNVTLASSLNPSTFADSVTFTTTVSSSSGTPVGTVAFMDGTSDLMDVPLDASGKASFTTSALSVATHHLTAAYAGNAVFLGGTSTNVDQVVTATATVVALSSATNPSVLGSPVSFAATVTPQGGGATPTGIVTFTDDSVSLGDANLDSTGTATLTTSSLTLGSHPIVATYTPDARYTKSASTTLAQVVAVTIGDAGDIVVVDAGTTPPTTDTDAAVLPAVTIPDGGDVPLFDDVVVEDGGGGCGCRMSNGGRGGFAALFAAVIALLALRRRR